MAIVYKLYIELIHILGNQHIMFSKEVEYCVQLNNGVFCFLMIILPNLLLGWFVTQLLQLAVSLTIKRLSLSSLLSWPVIFLHVLVGFTINILHCCCCAVPFSSLLASLESLWSSLLMLSNPRKTSPLSVSKCFVQSHYDWIWKCSCPHLQCIYHLRHQGKN